MATWRCPDCPATYGAWLSGCPRCRSAKELVMALNVCGACMARFAVGLIRCPQCQSTDFQEDGAMPKITRLGGPSIAGASVTGGQWGEEAEPEEATADVGEQPAVGDEGGEEPSASSSSKTSSETPSSEPEQSEKPTRLPARKTASRSKKAPTENSSAPSTGGGQADGTSDSDEAAK